MKLVIGADGRLGMVSIILDAKKPLVIPARLYGVPFQE